MHIKVEHKTFFSFNILLIGHSSVQEDSHVAVRKVQILY